MPYPSSLDVFPTILSTTKRNASGFELDLLLNQGFDAIEALEAGLGTGASNATPTAGKVRRATGTGTAEWGAVQTGDIASNAVTLSGMSRGSTNDPSVSSTSFATIQGDGTSSELRVDLTTVSGSEVEVIAVLTARETSGSGDSMTLAISVDGGGEVGHQSAVSAITNGGVCITSIYRLTGLSVATHIFRARYAVSAGTWTMNGTQRAIIVREFRR